MKATNLMNYPFLLIVYFFFTGKTQFIKKAPDFFCSFICTLGDTSTSTNGNFNCPTPYVIPSAVRYNIAIAEVSKQAAGQIQIYVGVSASSISNVTNFVININYAGNFNMYISYFVIAIGNQPENTWVDMLQVVIPADASQNTMMGGQDSVRAMTFSYTASNFIKFSDLTGVILIPLIGSYSILTYSSTVKSRIQLTAWVVNFTTFYSQVQVYNSVACQFISGFILFYKPSSITNDIGSYKHDALSFSSFGDISWNFKIQNPAFGPRFNTKCFLGYWDMSYDLDEDINFYFYKTAYQNFYLFQNHGLNSSSTIFQGNSFCLGLKLQCGEVQNFYDSIADACYTASTCPVATINPGILPAIPQLCKLCVEQECIDCTSLDRDYCILCNATNNAVAVGGNCVCMSGYWLSGTNCVLNCTYFLLDCKISNCSSPTYCTGCVIGSYLNYVSNVSQNCPKCSTAIQNCSQCLNQYQCTKCPATYYVNPYPVLLEIHSNCTLCNTTIPNCKLCQNGTNCSTCYTGFIVSMTGCQCAFTLMTGCGNCTKPNECTVCNVNYFLNPTTKLCNLCTTLFQCTSCISYKRCTHCNGGYASVYDALTDSSACQACSSIMTNCISCSSSTTCTSCYPNYGLTTTNQCQLCSTLLNHCQQCTDYSVCDACEANNQTFMHNGQCLQCSDLDQECIGCFYDGKGIYCTQCAQGYYLDPTDRMCYKCSQTIWDCETCVYNNVSLKAECTLCSSLFLVDSNMTCEKCKEFKYVTRTCTNEMGCTSSHMINGTLVCLSCDASLYFAYNTTTKKCQCQNGFVLDTLNAKCLEFCGDGLKMMMECDDDNQINGDGCSSECKVEQNFQCTSNSSGASSCVLNQDISVVFDYMLREMGENKVSLYFTVTPPSTALNKVDWQKTITFNFSEPINAQFSYQNGILIMTLEFSSDIEGKLLNMEMLFNSSVINSRPQSLSLKMNAINGPLTYSDGSSFSSYKAFKYSGLVIGIFCIVFYLVSSYFHKMIGLETIQFIQLIYFSRLMSSGASQPSFYGFNSLKNSNGYNDLTSSNASPQTYKSLPSSFIKLDLSLYFLDNCNLMLIPIALALVAYIIYSTKRSYHRSQFLQTQEKVQQDKYTITTRKVNFVYDNLIFSFTLALLYVLFYSSIVYMKSIQQSLQVTNKLFANLSLGVNLLILFIFCGIFCFESINGIQKYIQMNKRTQSISKQKNLEHDANTAGNGFHPLYVSVYLFYQLGLICVMNLMFTDIAFVTETVLAMTVVYLGVIAYWKPYFLQFHNYSIVANQLTVVFFIGALLAIKYKLLSSTLFTVIMFLTLASILISLVIQIIRLYLHRKNIAFQSATSKPQSTPNQVMDKKVSLLNEHNPFLVENQIKAYNLKQTKQIERNMFGKFEVKNHSEHFKKFFLNKKNLSIYTNTETKQTHKLTKSRTQSNPPLDQANLHFQEEQIDYDRIELEQIKSKLRHQLEQFSDFNQNQYRINPQLQ